MSNMEVAASDVGRPAEGRQRVLDAVSRLSDTDEIDAAMGGVATATIADELGISRERASVHCKYLTEHGKLERVNGIGPNGPRLSYLLANGDDGNRESPKLRFD